MIEVELRLPTKHQYAYVGVKIQGETSQDVQQELANMQGGLIDSIAGVYNQAMDAVQPSTSRASVAKATKVNVAPGENAVVVTTDTTTAEELIKSELGGTVVSVTEAIKPWERKKPANAAALEDF